MLRKSLIGLILAGACLIGGSSCVGQLRVSGEARENYGIRTSTFTPSDSWAAHGLFRDMLEKSKLIEKSYQELNDFRTGAVEDGVLTREEYLRWYDLLSKTMQLENENLEINKKYKQLLPSEQVRDYQKLMINLIEMDINHLRAELSRAATLASSSEGKQNE